jgi:hypothetical protein
MLRVNVALTHRDPVLELARRQPSLGAAIPLITDTKANGRRGREGPTATSRTAVKARHLGNPRQSAVTQCRDLNAGVGKYIPARRVSLGQAVFARDCCRCANWLMPVQAAAGKGLVYANAAIINQCVSTINKMCKSELLEPPIE